ARHSLTVDERISDRDPVAAVCAWRKRQRPENEPPGHGDHSKECDQDDVRNREPRPGKAPSAGARYAPTVSYACRNGRCRERSRALWHEHMYRSQCDLRSPLDMS